jgi:S-disulfanyl-L-cysteine oxidoreductase SoxD
MLRSAVTLLLCSVAFAQSGPGRPATEAEIKAQDLTILPNGTGLPKGRGDAKQGSAIFKDKCAVCHNEKGEGRENQYPALAGGIGSLGGSSPKKTVGSYWPYATTLFDYVRRAMPYDHPRSLSTDEVYSVSAFVLYLSGIVKETEELNEKTLPQVKMPNRDGFIPDSRPDVKTKGK